ncbi:MAG TPA: phosphoenolpyruvate--protein phosphotransferase [Candidatus Sulfomarinibacteraceae bacterium]|nr:phosphoenolpyruvate--protein phosphotransferase [Candidatus Sulfomarinibacteraceae bacterium]
MREFEVVIRNPTGLHARPAKVLVNTAKQFDSDIHVMHGQKKANAKSLISLLTLGAERGAQIRVTADGDDEEQAINSLKDAIRGGLGEEMPDDGSQRDGRSPAQSTGSEPAAATTPKADDVVEEAKDAPADGLIEGIAAAPGLAIGPLFVLQAQSIEVDDAPFAGVDAEQERLRQAREEARAQLRQVQQQIAAQAPKEAAIFDVHRELVDDPDLIQDVEERIAQGQNAPRAWQQAVNARAEAVAALSDPMLAERATDLRDVGRRVLQLLTGAAGARLPDDRVIVVAGDLTPSDTALLSGRNVLGFCTAAGGPTAHAAIIARALRLPAVVGAGPGVLSLTPGATAILDGNAGTLTVDPPEEALAQARAKQAAWQAQLEAALVASDEPAVTRDGHRVEVAANIGGVKDAHAAATSGAEAVGLLRTEFLFLGRTTAPSEAEQEQVYGEIVEAMGGRPVIIRTLDIGGDKPLPYVQVPEEANPFLGERGIRLCLARPALLRRQVRAILRAARSGPVRIMFPMVATVDEWRQARAIVQEERRALVTSDDGGGVPQVELGIMIEIPSAALLADRFAPEVDFFSVGTNDLTQYTLAMDRMHPTLSAQSDGLHPAVLRLIKQTVSSAHDHGKWVGVCGELAADPQAAPILIGLGVDELSVSVPAVASLKAQIRTLALADARALAQQALDCDNAGEVRALSTTAAEPEHN